MGYCIELEKISIDEYRKRLESAYLPPGRMILKEKTDERFGYFKNSGIKNIGELMNLLRRKNRFDELSKVDCFSDEYLTVLLRELNSMLSKPTKLADFEGIAHETISKLKIAGISNTEKLYNNVIKISDRQKLAASTGLNYHEIIELTGLSDLLRIKWVGATYARILFDLGVDSVEKVSKSDAIVLHSKINQLIKKRNNFKGAISLNDVRILIESAGELTFEIEY
jgi:hypothetical protein